MDRADKKSRFIVLEKITRAIADSMHTSVLRLFFFCFLISEILTFAIVSVMGLLLYGSVLPGYLITGFVCAGICTLAIVAFVLAVKDYIRKAEKLSEQALQDSEAKFGTLAEKSPNMIFVHKARRIVYANEKCEEILGYPRRELLSPEFDFFRLLARADRAVALKNYARHRRGKENEPVVHTLVTRGGETFPAIVTTRLIQHGGEAAILGIATDISDLQAITEALRESEEKYRTLVEATGTGYLIVDGQGRVFDANNEYVRLTGFASLAEIIGRSVIEWTAPHDRKRNAREVARCIETGSVSRLEIDYVHPDGSLNPIEINARVMDMGGEQRILALCRDISTRKKSEEERLRSLRLVQRVMDTVPDIFYMLDLDGRLIHWNSAVERITGLPALELQGKPALEMIHPEDRQLTSEAIARVYREGEATVESRILNADGGSILHFFSGVVMKDDEGGISGMVGAAKDISERVNAERAVRMSEQNLRNLFATVEDLFFILDMDGTIVEVNNRVLESFGYERDELVGSSIMKLVPEDRAAEAVETITTVVGGGSKVCHVPLRASNGELVKVETKASLGTWGDRPVIFGVTRDMTERLRLEEEMLRTRKLESLGVLAGGIAHDFNNLLTAVVGNISLAKSLVVPGSEVGLNLELAEKASEAARNLTQQLLTFSRGGTPVRRSMLVSDLIRESARFVLSGSNVRCEFDIADDLWPVNIDEGQIGQVINNIVINADQAMPGGGTLTIGAANRTVDPEDHLRLAEGRYVEIVVSDQGVGIAEKHLSTIFDPYFTTKQKGSGLGLASAHSIVANHEGSITVESEQGAGTTVRVFLPASTIESVAEKRRPEAPVEGSGRVLVMDDDELIQVTLGKMLQAMGYEVECANEGSAALELYREALGTDRAFDMVIMDLTIPGGMGGKEAISELLRIDPEARAIVSSGYSTDPIMADHAAHGFAGVIIKPYTIEQLRRALAGLSGPAR